MSVAKKMLFPALLFAALSFPLNAQSSGGELPSEPDWIVEEYDLYTPGSKVFVMSLGTTFPVLALDSNFSSYQSNTAFAGNINLGGTGSIAFFWFLTPRWFLGGELQGMFASTYGENMLYIVPISARGGYQFVLGIFEIPLSFSVGFYTASKGQNYLGLFLKAEASFFWRFHDEWSVGFNTAWWFLPQWPKDRPDRNHYLNIVETTLAVRFHF
jgi:hypothetical protein